MRPDFAEEAKAIGAEYRAAEQGRLVQHWEKVHGKAPAGVVRKEVQERSEVFTAYEDVMLRLKRRTGKWPDIYEVASTLSICREMLFIEMDRSVALEKQVIRLRTTAKHQRESIRIYMGMA